MWRPGGLLLFVLLVGAFAPAVRANVQLAAPFVTRMVLQRDMPVPVWGKATPGESVTVSFGGQNVTTTTDGEGKWVVWLQPLSASQRGTMTVKGNNTVTITDVVVGEVWLCSGQSNMETYLSDVNGQEDPTILQDINYPDIRMFKIAKEVTPQPVANVTGSWIAVTPANSVSIGAFSALGFLVARDLHKLQGVPVGIMQATFGGSRIEAWMPREVLESRPQFQAILAAWADREAIMPPTFAQYKIVAQTDPAVAAIDVQEIPARLYNGMIAALMPYGIKGVLWYQGESGAYQPEIYRDLFPAMVSSWRERWGRPDLPFVFVQLPAYQTPVSQPVARSFWGDQRESQATVLNFANTFMVVSLDIGGTSIHPWNKTRLAPRLLRSMRGGVYGENIPYRYPRFDRLQISGPQVRVTFKDVGGGLATSDAGPVRGFALAGSNGRYYWADAAAIEGGDTVVVSSTNVAQPVAVSYAYADNPPNNLVTTDGLPASPFPPRGPGIAAEVNQPPQVEAGGNRSLMLSGPSVSTDLSGTASDDGLPAWTTLKVSWTKVSGPDSAALGDSSSAATTATFTEPGDYVFRLTADDGFATASDTLTVTVSSPVPTPVAAIKCGDMTAGYQGADGVTYVSDRLFLGGLVGGSVAPIPIAETEDDALYQKYRGGNHSYRIPAEPGRYEVEMKFSDNATRAGVRIFDVTIEGQKALENFDIRQEAAANTALVKTVTVDVSDSFLEIAFTNVKGNAKINALVVRKLP